MSKNQMLTRIAAVLTTLAETGGGPESSIYLALGADLSAWEMLRAVLLENHLVNISGNYVTLTGKGASLAEQCNAALAGR